MRIWIGASAALGIILAGPATSPAAEEGAERLTPEGAVELALRNHPALRAAGRDVTAAEADHALARSGYLPRLDLTEDLGRSTNPVFVFASKLGQEVFGPADFAVDSLNQPDPFTNAATRLILRQSVWDAGRTHLGSRAAGLGVTAAGDAARRRGEEIAFSALRAFWDVVLADEMRVVTAAAEEAAKANRDLAHQQVEAGIAVPSDRLSAEVRLAEVRAMRIRSDQAARVARAALRQALGLTEQPVFELAPPSVLPAPPVEDPEAVVSTALARRADLQALERRILQAEIGERIARSRLLPEIGVGAQMEWNDETAFGTGGRNWTVGASLRLPVFDGLETRARLEKARAERAKLADLREALAEGIRLEVSAAWADVVSASERLQVAESALGHSEEALRIVRERYAEGLAVIVELLGSEAGRTEAQGNRAAAQRDLALARAALDLAAGRQPAAGSEAAVGEEDR